MRRHRFGVALVVGAWALFFASHARAQSPLDGGAPPDGASPNAASVDGGAPALSPADQQALERALAGDAAARAAAARPGAPSPVTNPNAGLVAGLSRAFQSLNPDLSAIVDFAGGLYDGTIIKSGDDPGDTGANLQEVEVAFSAAVDPYFRGDVYLTIPNLGGLEVEEAYLTTLSLPASLQLRAGMLRASFGRQNTQHLHVQDFTRRPQLNAMLLGTDGLRAPGAELSWLVPVPFYLLLTGGAYSVAPPDDSGPLRTFGGGNRTDFTYLGNLRTFAPLSDEVSLLLGLSFATGKWVISPSALPDNARRSYLYGADLYLKWQPPNVSQTWLMLGWQTEFLLRHIPDYLALFGQNTLLEGALYSQLILRVARRWVLGVRGEVDGLPADVWVPRQYAGSGSITWNLSEFARVRLFGEARYTPRPTTSQVGIDITQGWSSALFLQLEASIGAHGAHAY